MQTNVMLIGSVKQMNEYGIKVKEDVLQKLDCVVSTCSSVKMVDKLMDQFDLGIVLLSEDEEILECLELFYYENKPCLCINLNEDVFSFFKQNVILYNDNKYYSILLELYLNELTNKLQEETTLSKAINQLDEIKKYYLEQNNQEQYFFHHMIYLELKYRLAKLLNKTEISDYVNLYQDYIQCYDEYITDDNDYLIPVRKYCKSLAEIAYVLYTKEASDEHYELFKEAIVIYVANLDIASTTQQIECYEYMIQLAKARNDEDGLFDFQFKYAYYLDMEDRKKALELYESLLTNPRANKMDKLLKAKIIQCYRGLKQDDQALELGIELINSYIDASNEMFFGFKKVYQDIIPLYLQVNEVEATKYIQHLIKQINELKKINNKMNYDQILKMFEESLNM